jgi:hypothetical protein
MTHSCVRIGELNKRWRRAPRRWGHPLHSLCSYFAMFPPQVPHVFIRWLTQPGDVVYDPFAGRGTAPMEACRLGRFGVGSDANPLAYILTTAKVDPPDLLEAVTRLADLRRNCKPSDPAQAPDDIRMLYHPRVLGQLLWLRQALDKESRADRFLIALLLGVMHANYRPGAPARGLSISMPNTFSMSPGYVSRYIHEHRLLPPDIDVFDLLKAKLARMHLPNTTATRGRAWQQDARDSVPRWLRENPAKLIFTSPPYLRVIKYGKYNWVRLWMLKQDPKDVDNRLVATESLQKYQAFMAQVLLHLDQAVRDDGYLCLMIGDVRECETGETINLAEHVWERAASPLGWQRVTVIADHLPTQHKVSRIWKHSRGNATKTDRILIMSKSSNMCRKLPGLGPIRWSSCAVWE